MSKKALNEWKAPVPEENEKKISYKQLASRHVPRSFCLLHFAEPNWRKSVSDKSSALTQFTFLKQVIEIV